MTKKIFWTFLQLSNLFLDAPYTSSELFGSFRKICPKVQEIFLNRKLDAKSCLVVNLHTKNFSLKGSSVQCLESYFTNTADKWTHLWCERQWTISESETSKNIKYRNFQTICCNFFPHALNPVAWTMLRLIYDVYLPPAHEYSNQWLPGTTTLFLFIYFYQLCYRHCLKKNIYCTYVYVTGTYLMKSFKKILYKCLTLQHGHPWLIYKYGLYIQVPYVLFFCSGCSIHALEAIYVCPHLMCLTVAKMLNYIANASKTQHQ